MIPSGLVHSLVAWATGNTTRIAQLVAERDALVTGFISGGKAAQTMLSASANGKSFSFSADLSREDKLSVLTNVLTHLGEIDAADLPPTVTYPAFDKLTR